MNRVKSLAASRRVRSATVLVAYLAPAFAMFVGLMQLSGSEPSRSVLVATAGMAASQTKAAAPMLDPKKVMGAKTCIECHKSETKAWSVTVHSKNVERITSDAGKKISKAYGSEAVCMDCHATPKMVGSKVEAISGVSCESCHSASGGKDGWLNLHAVYGPQGTTMETETAKHRADRIKGCEAAGMIRPERIYDLAVNCLECHIVGNEKLLQAGHKPGQAGFDLIPWLQGEMRHNFHQNQAKNAEAPSLNQKRTGQQPVPRKRVMLIVSQLSQIEVCLRNLAAVNPDNLKEDYAKGWNKRAEEAFDYLADVIVDEFKIEDDDLDAVLEAVDEVGLGRRFKDQEAAAKAADVVAKGARSFVKNHDGSKLNKDVDELFEELSKPKGKSYEP